MPRQSTAKSTARTASRRPPATVDNAIKLLHQDHRKVIALFDRFEKLHKSGKGDDETMQTLVETACNALTVHARIEEEIFYPAAREAIEQSDLLDEAEVEHASARQLIAELSSMQPGDDLYEAKFTVLGEYVKHHIEEEEKEIFPALKKARIDLDTLGHEMQARKLELHDELGIPHEDEAEDTRASARSSARRHSVH